MKKFMLILAFLITFASPIFAFASPATAYCEASEGFDLFPQESEKSAEFSEILDEQLRSLELSNFDEFLKGEGETIFDGSFYDTVISILNGEYFNGEKNLLSGIFGVFFAGVQGIIPTFVTLLCVTVLLSVLANVAGDFLKPDMQNLLSFALVLVIISMVALDVIKVAKEVKSGIEILSSQAEKAFPILITLVYALGGTASASCFSPTLYFLSNVIMKIASSYIFEIFMFIFGLNMINALSPSLKFSGLSDFFLSISKYVLGITFTVFSACTALQGISAGGFDSVSFRTAKYAIANSVPVIGSYVRDGFDLILFSGVLVKNAVGIGFVILAFVTILTPLVKVVCLTLALKLCEGLSETFAPKAVTSLYKNVAKSLSLISVCYIAVFFMYSIAVIMLMICTNIVL